MIRLDAKLALWICERLAFEAILDSHLLLMKRYDATTKGVYQSRLIHALYMLMT